MYLWLGIVRRDFWPVGLRFPEGRVFEDATVVPHLGLAARSYFHIDQSLVTYQVRSGSIMAGVKYTRQAFDMEAHLDFAEAFQGFRTKSVHSRAPGSVRAILSRWSLPRRRNASGERAPEAIIMPARGRWRASFAR